MFKSFKYLLNTTLLALCVQFAFADVAVQDSRKVINLNKESYKQDFGGGQSTTRSAPSWSVNAADYEFPATIDGAIIINEGAQMGGTGDMFGAFGGDGSVRGVGTFSAPSFGPYAGTPVWAMQMYSNAAGDAISFQYYDASADEILQIGDSYTFVINDILGSLTGPITLNIGEPDLSCSDDDAL